MSSHVLEDVYAEEALLGETLPSLGKLYPQSLKWTL